MDVYVSIEKNNMKPLYTTSLGQNLEGKNVFIPIF